ncbi:FAD-dependent oxidase [Usnea florida]
MHHLASYSLVTLLACLLPLAASSNQTQVLAALKVSGLSPFTQIILASDTNYKDETVQRWTIHDQPTYIASVKPALKSDVQKIIGVCSKYNVPFLATGGGHGFSTTLGRLQDGIEIDLSFFRNVTVDKDASTMTIGGAVIFRDTFEPLSAAGKEITTGSSGCVGFLGATLGGGVGRYNGLHGMILDSLRSVEIVTGAGDLVTASTTQNPELFWGIRGAGFSYGIITSATYEVYNFTYPSVVNADMIFPLNQSVAVLNYFKSFEKETPARLSLILLMGYAQKYGGPLSEAEALLEPLISANPSLKNITAVPWKSLVSSAFFGAEPADSTCTKDLVQNVYGGGIKTYDIPTFQTFFYDLNNFYMEYPSAQGSVFFIEHFPWQAVRAVSDEETAYPHRDFTAHLLYNYAYTDPNLESTVDNFAKSARTRIANTSGLAGLQVYVSYAHGDEPVTDIYGQRKLGRLRALKRMWDPRGVFDFDNPF